MRTKIPQHREPISVAAILVLAISSNPGRTRLDIYFIDVEAVRLHRNFTGESLLIDSG
jgi:hypothetical protein